MLSLACLLFTVNTVRAGGSTAPPSGVTLTASASSVVAGGFLSYGWAGANTADTNDWIVFTTGSAPSSSNYISDAWQYTYGTQVKTGASPTASGSISVKAPSTVGTYTAWYCLNNGYTCPASVKITVTNPQVTCLDPGATASAIKHVVIVISENHSFDAYFGNYCQAQPGTFPTCNTGRQCCAAITPIINGVKPIVLNDAANKAYDNDHVSTDEICEMNGGKMDKYIGSGGCKGSDNRNYAACDGSVGSCSQYWSWASQYAMADNFFQSAAGQSSMNDMYFARGAYVFTDNDKVPQSDNCYIPFSSSKASYSDPVIVDLLNQCSVPWTFYAEQFTMSPPFLGCYPTHYDPSDDPFEYYPSVRGNAKASTYFRPFTAFQQDVAAGTLPAVSYIKPLGTNSEHPGDGAISDGEKFNAGIISSILNNPQYAQNTLILLVPDESGGFRDSVAPPGTSHVDNQPYGPRIPFIAVGPFALSNYISHVQMEPSSIVRFLESNFLGGHPGQLQTRDAVVNNIGSMLDTTKTGYVFP